MFLAKEHNVDFFTWSYHGDGFFDPRVQDAVGARMHQLIVRFDGFFGEWGTPESDWKDLGEKITARIRDGTLDQEALKKNSEKTGQHIVSTCPTWTDPRIRNATDAELASGLEDLYASSAELVAQGFIPVASDFHHACLTHAMEDAVSNHTDALKRQGASVPECVSFLSSAPLSPFAWEETKHFFERVAQTVADKGIESVAAKNALEEHARLFRWIHYGYLGPAWTADDFAQRVEKTIREHPDPTGAFLAKENERKTLPVRQQERMDALGLDESERRLFASARTFLYLKAYRVDVRSLASFTFDRIFKEIGRRHGLTRNQLHCASLSELVGMLQGKPLDVSVLNRRFSGFTFYWSDEGQAFLYGDEQSAFLKKNELHQDISFSDELRGQVACPGVVKGRVKIVMTAVDNSKVIHGDILVSLATNPDLLPAMHRARAFVTDMGGITSHAAIVAREMNKPCVIGTKFASKVLKDGDFIEVNATEGWVRKLPVS